MRTKFTFKTQKLFATALLAVSLLGAKLSSAQALFKAGATYYINGVGNDLVAPKDTFASLAGSGAVYTGGAYSSATGIFYALSVNGIDSNSLGQLTILLVPGYTGIETNFPVIKGVLYTSPSRHIVLKPAAGANYTITRSAAITVADNALIRMEGTQFFTIEGEGTAGQRNLTFAIPVANSSSTSIRVVDIVTNPAVAVGNSFTNTVAIKNCNIIGTLTGTNANITAGVLIGSIQGVNQSPAKRADSVSVINCNIQNVQYGVYARGISGTTVTGLQDGGLIIKNNTIGGALNSYIGSNVAGQPVLSGIYIANQKNALIEGNIISKCSPASTGFAGIVLHSPNGQSTDSNVVVTRNLIHSLNLTNPVGVFGIRLNHVTPHSQDLKIKISNNVISNLTSPASINSTASVTFPVGISIEDNTSNAGVDIFNNSISLSGAYLNGGTAACIYIGGGVTGGVQLMNNVLSNRMENQIIVNPTNLSPLINPAVNNPYYHIAAVITNTTNEPFDSIDNNIYDVSTTGGWAHIGRNSTVGYASLKEWKTFTGDDEKSWTIFPVFNDPISLITNNNAPTTYGSLGKSLVSNDFSGNPRPNNNQSIGAYQFTQDIQNANVPLKSGSFYYINGSSNYPTTASSNTGSFRNIGDFATYLNSYGTDVSTGGTGLRVNVIIQAGYNTGSGDTAVIPAFRPHPNMDGTRSIHLSIESGVKAVVTLPLGRTIPNNSALFRLYGVQGFTIDGKNNGVSGTRNITFQLPSSATSHQAKVMILAPTVNTSLQRNIILGCNMIGSTVLNSSTSLINTQVGLYVGDPFSLAAGPGTPLGLGNCLGGANVFNLIGDNFIGGVRYGIYWRSKFNAADDNNNIFRNFIGGIADTAKSITYYIGGTTPVSAFYDAGIFLKGFSQGILDSNVIKNSNPLFNGFRGIDIDGGVANELGKSSSLNVTRNSIYNLGSTAPASGYAAGIRVALNGANLNLRITNNFIARIYGSGSGNLGTLTSPVGIWFDNISPAVNIGAYVSHNTVHLSQTSIDVVPGGVTTAIHFGAGHSGIGLRHNILSNTSGRVTLTTPGTSYTAAITFASPTNTPATLSLGVGTRGNVYYAKGKNSYNFLGFRGGVGVQMNGLQDLYDYMGYAGQNPPLIPDFGFSAWGEAPFLNDTSLFMNPMYVGHIARNPINTYDGIVDRDILGIGRGSNMISVGALQFTTIYTPLKPTTYHVNGVNIPPTDGVPDGYFSTINNLFRYINTNGVDGVAPPKDDITVLIESGYVGEGDTLITPLYDYPRMGPNRLITIRPAPGMSPVISSTATSNNSAFDGTSSVIKFLGASYVTIDGSNGGNNGKSRDLTIRMPVVSGNDTVRVTNAFTRVIDIMAWGRPATNNAIMNCNIIGHSTTSAIYSYAGIYQGGVNFVASTNNVPLDPVLSKNDYNTYRNNYIVGVKYGVRLIGKSSIAGAQDFNNTVAQNEIGGNTNVLGATPTNYWGGIATAAAISAVAQADLKIDSNVIKNNIRVGFTNNSGIELTTMPTTANLATDSSVTISRNIIKDIITTNTTGSFGVYINTTWTRKKSYNIINNMISGIASTGGAAITSNPYGIFLNGTSVDGTADHDVNIYNNSINLGAASTMVGGISACIALNNSPNVKLKIRLENNILQNRLTRSTAGGPIYAILTNLNTNPFIATENNNYYVAGANSVNHIAVVNFGLASAINYTTFPQWVALTNQDTLSLNYLTPFTNDNDLIIPNGTASPLYMGGTRKAIVNNDVLGKIRPAIATNAATIGAHEFTGSYADSAAPRIYDFSDNSDCFFNPFGLTFTTRVYDKNPVLNDTMYYRLSFSNTDTFALPSIVNGYERKYDLPGLPDNESIEYWFVTVDGAGKRSTFVNAFASGTRFFASKISNFPINTGFDLPNFYGWQVQQISGPSKWDIESFGSGNNPFLYPLTGAKAAVLPATPIGSGPLGALGSVSRLVSPCLDLFNMNTPTLRLFVSQNYDNDLSPTSKDKALDSIVVNILFAGSAVPVPGQQPIVRVNPDFVAPGYKVYDVCLQQLAGIKIGIDGHSKKGGAAIVIDSIIIFDNFVDNVISPASQQNCFNDSFTVQVTSSSSQNDYYLFDDLTQKIVGPRVRGNGGALNVQGYMPTSDSAYIKVGYVNITSKCDVKDAPGFGYITNISKIYFGTFKNGPFISPSTLDFYGMFNSGDITSPDAVRAAGNADYAIKAPGSATDAEYGITWEIAQVQLRNTLNDDLNNNRLTIIPPSGGNPAYVRFAGDSADNNKLFEMSIILRLLPNGCDSVITRLVRVAYSPLVDFYAYNDSICAGEGVYFQNVTQNNVFTLPVTYSWDFGDGTTSSQFIPIKKFSDPGSYTVTLKARNNSTLMDSVSYVWVVKESPKAGYTFTLPCVGKHVTYTNTSTGNGLSYNWNFGGQITTDQNGSVVYPYSDTTLIVSLITTNDQGCRDTVVTPTTIFAQPTASFTANNVCAGATVLFNNTSTIAAGKNGRINTIGSEWLFGNGEIGYATNPLYQYPTGGNYSVHLKVISNFGCTDTISVPVSVYEKPVPSFTIDNTCRATNLNITNNTTFAGGLDKVIYNWNFGDNSAPSPDAIPTKQYGESRPFQVTLRVMDTVNNCVDSMMQTITIKESAKAEFVAENGCVGAPVKFTNISIVPALVSPSFTWTFGDNGTDTVPSPSHTYTAGGDKVVSFTVDIQGCKSIAYDTISVSAANPITFEPELRADSFTVDFIASSNAFSKYTWNFGDGSNSIKGPGQTNTTNIYPRVGTYTVTLVATDANGCSSAFSDTVRILKTVGINNDIVAAKFNFNLYPNPFATGTNVSIELDKNNQVSVEVYDMIGRKVYSKDKGTLSAGKHVIGVNESDFTAVAGAYLVKVKIGSEIITRQLIKQ